MISITNAPPSRKTSSISRKSAIGNGSVASLLMSASDALKEASTGVSMLQDELEYNDPISSNRRGIAGNTG